VLVGVIVAVVFTWPAYAAADPVTFAHGTIDQQLTTTQPGSPAGSHFTGTYHAAGDPGGDPPYMRRMTFYPPPGMQYDTSVPERCTASDAELQLRGPAACPPGSRIGAGTASAKAMGEVRTVDVEVFNNTGEQIMVIASPGLYTVSRGKIAADGTTVFESPTCFPHVGGTPCAIDNTLQLGSDVTFPAYVRDGRGYLTTPSDCPASGNWESTVRFWWKDGTEDAVVLRQPCAQPSA
jgi:hypothetical protein